MPAQEQLNQADLQLEELDLAPVRLTGASDPLKSAVAAADDVFALASLVPSWNQRLPTNDTEDKDFVELFLAANQGAGFTPKMVEGNPNSHAGASDPSKLRLQIKNRLSVLELSNANIGPGGAAMLAEYLKSANGKCMTEIRLDCNMLGDNGARGICQAISNAHHITVLSMEMNGITKDSCVAISRMMKRVPTVAKLHVGNNALGDEGITTLSGVVHESNALSEIGLTATGMTAVGARAMADALANNTSLTSVLLNRNPMGDEGVIALCVALEKRNTLRCIELSDVGMGPEGCKRLAAVYKDSRTLTRMVVGPNALGDAGAMAIADALRENMCLTSVEMDKCGTTDTGAKAIVEALTANKESRVRALMLNENPISAPMLQQLQKLGEQRKIKVTAKNTNNTDNMHRTVVARIPDVSAPVGAPAAPRMDKASGGCGCSLM